ncbi:hypothetical protein [Thauera humireducens]|uniref:hypothetical protein n=1 Tax=Thauera humireducens TaxID=1134435 RepID=UPI00311D7DCE
MRMVTRAVLELDDGAWPPVLRYLLVADDGENHRPLAGPADDGELSARQRRRPRRGRRGRQTLRGRTGRCSGWSVADWAFGAGMSGRPRRSSASPDGPRKVIGLIQLAPRTDRARAARLQPSPPQPDAARRHFRAEGAANFIGQRGTVAVAQAGTADTGSYRAPPDQRKKNKRR